MRKLIVLISFMALIISGISFAAENNLGSHGPAPNSGDCIPDGSGFESPNGPNGEGVTEPGNGPAGPAPNSGDGVPDGSGLEAPNGPNDE